MDGMTAGQFTVGNKDLTVVREMYQVDGSLAVVAFDGDCEPYCILSVHMPGPVPPVGVFFLKDWSEMHGIADAFIDSGLIEPAPEVPPRETQGPMPMQVLAYRFKTGGR